MAHYRAASVRDVDAVLEIMRSYYAEDGYEFVETEARRAALTLIGNSHLGQLFVADDDGGVIGYLAVTLGFSLEYRGLDAFVDELYVAKAHRGRGLGREALEVAEAWCRERGVRAMHLEVERHRESAFEIYRRFGFDSHDRYLMTKLLDHPERK